MRRIITVSLKVPLLCHCLSGHLLIPLVNQVGRFLSFEHSLSSKGWFDEVGKVTLEYLEIGHAEEVPLQDLDKHKSKVFYLLMHVVCKGSSSTTKVRAVFDASAKSVSGVSLNDTLLVGPTVHSPLSNV